MTAIGAFAGGSACGDVLLASRGAVTWFATRGRDAAVFGGGAAEVGALFAMTRAAVAEMGCCARATATVAGVRAVGTDVRSVG